MCSYLTLPLLFSDLYNQMRMISHTAVTGLFFTFLHQQTKDEIVKIDHFIAFKHPFITRINEVHVQVDPSMTKLSTLGYRIWRLPTVNTLLYQLCWVLFLNDLMVRYYPKLMFFSLPPIIMGDIAPGANSINYPDHRIC